MDYQTALEACRAYKECHLRLRKAGIFPAADEMQLREEWWRKEYVRLANEQQAAHDAE